MIKFKLTGATRLFLFIIAIILWCGLLLTGISNVHWFMFVVPVVFPIAALINFCPGMALTRSIVKEEKKPE